MSRRIPTATERFGIASGRAFDRHLRGGTIIARPTGLNDQIKLQSDARPSAKVGETCTLVVSGTADGFLTYSALKPGRRAGGFDLDSFPNEGPRAGANAYYDVAPDLDFGQFATASLALYAGDDLIDRWTPNRPWRRVTGVAPYDTVDAGDRLRLWTDHPGTPDGKVNYRLVDVPRFVAADALLGGYRVGMNAFSDVFFIRRRHDGDPVGDTFLDSMAFTASSDTWYWMRGRVDGKRIRAKIWSGSVGSEPAGWMLDTVDPVPSSPGSGYAGVAAPLPASSTIERSIDVFEVSFDGQDPVATDFSEYPSTSTPDGWDRLVGVGSPTFTVRDEAAATGGKILAYSGGANNGEWRGWVDAGISADMEVLARVRTSPAGSIGIILRGNVHTIGTS